MTALAAQHDDEVMCEEFIDGDETTCPVLEINGEAVDSTEKLASVLDMRSRGWNYAIERNGQRLTQSIR